MKTTFLMKFRKSLTLVNQLSKSATSRPISSKSILYLNILDLQNQQMVLTIWSTKWKIICDKQELFEL